MNTKRVFIRLIPLLPSAVAALALLVQSAWAQTAPSIIQQPASQTNLAGENLTLSVRVSGKGPFRYQWRFKGTNLPNDTITTVAGGGAGDGGPASDASLNDPSSVAIDAAGDLFIADYYNNRVRKVDTNGVITTVAGSGSPGFSGDGGTATDARLDFAVTSFLPSGVVVDNSGNLFIADSNNKRIRKVNAKGIITTVAGNGSGLDYGPGDGGAATNAGLGSPVGLALDASGNLFIADWEEARIRKVDINGIITTVAGTGSPGFSGDGGVATNARLQGPTGVAVDVSGNLFIADGNWLVRRVDTKGIITTVAGGGTNHPGDGGAATYASISPVGLAVDASGNLFIADWKNRILKMDINGVITAVAGNGSGGYSGDGGFATNASLNYPSGVAVDQKGNLFIADWNNSRIRKATTSGIISTAAGNGSPSYSGDGGSATNASLAPSGVAVDVSGNLFIADGNNVIRAVNTNGVITTVAGNGTIGYSGDGGSATNASLYVPTGLAMDASGNLFIADGGNKRIRKVNANGIITTVAGGGNNYPGDGGAATNASLYSPTGLAVDASGNLFIADEYDYRIRKIGTNGIISTVAGNGSIFNTSPGSGATNVGLYNPDGVAVDSSGNLFIADATYKRLLEVDVNDVITMEADTGGNPIGVAVDPAGNLFFVDDSDNRIYKLDANGIISTMAGNGKSDYSGDGGPATNASLNSPGGVAVDNSGNLFIADSANGRIRKVSLAGFPYLTLTNVSAANTGGFEVIIASPYGIVTSAIATLTVVPPPSIVIQPVNLAEVLGGTAVFDVAALGTPPLSYAWYFNRTNAVQSGANSTLSLTNLSLAGGGNYMVVVSSPFGSITSRVATLSVVYPVAIANEPISQTVLIGSAVTFNVATTGSAPFAYQWRFNGTNIPNATNAVYAIPSVTTNEAGYYAVVVTNVAEGLTSSNAALAVILSPKSQTIIAGETATLTAPAFSPESLNYQWQKHGTNLVNGGTITGATSGALVIANVSDSDAATYRAIVSDGHSSVTTSNAVLTVNDLPFIAEQPKSQKVVAGNNATFLVTAYGSPPLVFQWYFNNGSVGSPATGTNFSSYSLTNIDPSQAGYYSVVVVNGYGNATSFKALLTVIYPPSLALEISTGYPLLSLRGVLSSNFVVQYSNNLEETNWMQLLSLTNLSASPYQFLDPTGIGQPARFYRAFMK